MSTDEEPKVEDSSEDFEWSAHYDDEGRLYYYNRVTEESAWDPPADGKFKPAEQQSTAEWTAYKDEEGRTYYYNAATEETQWERPEEGTVVEAEEDATDSADPVDDDITTGRQDSAPTEEPVEHTNNVAQDLKEKQPDALPEQDPAVLSAATTEEQNESKDPMDVVEEEEEEAVEPEPIDPAVKQAQEAEAALQRTDSVLEPSCLSNVSHVVASNDGNPLQAVNMLIDKFHGQTASCGVLAQWLSAFQSTSAIRETVQEVLHKMVQEKFNEAVGDRILQLSQAAFLNKMMDNPRWRQLLIELSASHKDSAVLVYCLRAISKRGHHREIAKRVNQSEHFTVFNAMLQSELTILGRAGVSAAIDSMASIGLSELVSDLQRACCSTSYTYLYSIEVLQYLEDSVARKLETGSCPARLATAVQKWTALRQALQSAMIDPQTTIAGSSSLFRKRRLDVALKVNEFHNRRKKIRKGETSTTGKVEAGVLTLLKRNSNRMQLVDTTLDPLLPSGVDLNAARSAGALLQDHPVALKALLGHLFSPGSSRVTTPVLRNKCARLLAITVLAIEKDAMRESGERSAPSSESLTDVALTRMITDASQLCEQLESMVSFLVTVAGQKPGISPGEKLCVLALTCPAVAEGAMIWARDLTKEVEYASSPAFPTLSVSVLSLVRIICLKHSFTRRIALEISINFLRHSNSDISYQKVNSIKEQSLRIMVALLVKGEVAPVLGELTRRIEDKRSSDLDASLIRYFVSGVLTCISPPVSMEFAVAFGSFVKTNKCVDAIKSTYFSSEMKDRFHDILKSLNDMKGQSSEEASSILTSLGSLYSNP